MAKTDLPPDFDPLFYVEYHVDVAAAGIDAAEHYLAHGRKEGRLYRRADAPKRIEQGSNFHSRDRSPALSLAHHPATRSKATERIAQRLIEAYRHSSSKPSIDLATTGADLWTDIVNVHMKTFVDCLEAGDAERLALLLSEFGREYTWFGGITTGVDGFNHWARDEASVAFSYFDKLVTLAEAIGALPVENPEQGQGGNWGVNIQHSPDEIVRRIEAALGIEVLPPLGVLPVSGLRLASGILHYRHVNALYSAHRVRQLVQVGDGVCEYGGGIGLVAMYLARMGVRDYTLFDLPLVNVVSGYMLIGALGEHAVALEGEPSTREQVKIRAGASCRDEPDGRFVLALNQDSFPEIDRSVVLAYLAQIRRTSKQFLSINHEGEHATTETSNHLRVATLVESDKGFTRVYRMPYWLRRGYVEELFSVG